MGFAKGGMSRKTQRAGIVLIAEGRGMDKSYTTRYN